jgi:hypothetical protein
MPLLPSPRSPVGVYSLVDASQMTVGTPCKPCLQGALCYNGSQLVARNGYYRSANYSEQVTDLALNWARKQSVPKYVRLLHPMLRLEARLRTAHVPNLYPHSRNHCPCTRLPSVPRTLCPPRPCRCTLALTERPARRQSSQTRPHGLSSRPLRQRRPPSPSSCAPRCAYFCEGRCAGGAFKLAP